MTAATAWMARRTGSPALFAAMVAAGLLASCVSSRPWTLTVSNNHGTDAAIILVTVGDESSTWVLDPGETAILLNGPRRPGTIEVLDASCTRVASASFGQAPAILATVDRGVTGGGRWEISVGPDDPVDGLARPPSAVCR